ncbi:hypothetical protein HP1_110 [Candidatus Termititenax spirochaetophilus]|uniref:histidine kinase n=1 Tax=Candidatus Termititenax spirochaetophilus TaxID=2218522 RepID=A0A388T9V7_9BACT|nr:hypothetical protein HP1_110 [Candidatus Termititenax spirochaetophilus]
MFNFMKHKKNKEVLMIAEVSKLIGSTLNIQEIYGTVIKSVTDALDVDRGILFLYDDQKKEIYSTAGYGADTKDLAGISLQVGNSVLGRIFKEGKPVLVPHTTRNTEYVRRLGVISYVAVPLKAREKIIGLLAIDNAPSKRTLKYLNMDLLVALAGQMAVAIENAGLYADAQEKITELSRLDRMSSLGTMAAGIAHEIKNPLTSLKLVTQLLDMYQDKRDFWQEHGAIIGEEIQRLETIIEDFLSFARTPQVKIQPVKLSFIIHKVLNLVTVQARQENVDLSVNIDDSIKVLADTQKIMQVILNIVLNAVQAIPKNHTVKGRVEISAVSNNIKDSATITIRDNGCGISKENQEKLFSPFFTTKQKGTGLGLSIAYKIIEEHKGKIKVESELNTGTTFTIQLPLVKEEVLVS